MDSLDKFGDWLESIKDRKSQNEKVKYQTDCEIHGKFVEADHRGICFECSLERETARRNHELQVQKMNKARSAGINKRFLQSTLDSVKTAQRDVAEKLKNYQFDKNLVITGTTGTGKTYLATALINSVSTEKRCKFVKFYDLSDIKINDYEGFIDIIKCEFLVIDEFGSHDTDFKSSLIQKIYDYRYEEMLPTCLLTNLPGTKLKELLSDAVYSRIKSNCVFLALTGDDLRLQHAA